MRCNLSHGCRCLHPLERQPLAIHLVRLSHPFHPTLAKRHAEEWASLMAEVQEGECLNLNRRETRVRAESDSPTHPFTYKLGALLFGHTFLVCLTPPKKKDRFKLGHYRPDRWWSRGIYLLQWMGESSVSNAEIRDGEDRA